MKRNAFFTVLGISAGTLIFAPFLTACSKSNSVLTNTTLAAGSGALDFTLDLTQAANAAITTNGGSLVKGRIIVARTSAGVYVAVASTCTHLGYALGFNSDDQFHCQNPAAGHGSIFRTTGSVVNGPAATALKMCYTSLTGTPLRVFA